MVHYRQEDDHSAGDELEIANDITAAVCAEPGNRCRHGGDVFTSAVERQIHPVLKAVRVVEDLQVVDQALGISAAVIGAPAQAEQG